MTYQTTAIAERLYEAILRIPARRKLARLEPLTAECMSIKATLLDMPNCVKTAQEEAWLNVIEARRAELNNSEEEVEIIGYGVGGHVSAVLNRKCPAAFTSPKSSATFSAGGVNLPFGHSCSFGDTGNETAHMPGTWNPARHFRLLSGSGRKGNFCVR
jgi:hypothetical protein